MGSQSINRRVRTVWTDLNGVTHGRYIPEHRLDHPTHHARTTLVMGIDGEILPVQGWAADVGYPDLAAKAVPASRRRGWEPDTDVVVCELTDHDGEPLALDPRAALARAVEAWRKRGLEPQLGFELELYLLERGDDGRARPAGGPGHVVYGTGLRGDTTGLNLEYFDMIEEMGLGLEGILTEFSPGQMEINLEYGSAVEATDRAVLCKEMTRELAARRGLIATYMGRPDATSVGSGLHINLSFVPSAGGPNALADAGAEHGLSQLARCSLGGMIAHHEALSALSAPLANSYKRLVPGLIAGYWANWGLDNRISTYRIPAERGPATRLENRMPCASANPYLAAAGMLQAALLGVESDTDCGDPQVGNADAAPNTDRHTPHTLGEALDALEADTELTEAIGSELVSAYITLRRYDLARCDAAGDFDPEQVTDWELETYLPYY